MDARQFLCWLNTLRNTIWLFGQSEVGCYKSGLYSSNACDHLNFLFSFEYLLWLCDNLSLVDALKVLDFWCCNSGGMSSSRLRSQEKCFKARGKWEKSLQWGGADGAWGGGFNWGVLICIWSCDVWGEGRIRKCWSVEKWEESSFSFARAPWVRHTEAAFVWLGIRERERRRRKRRRRRRVCAFRLEQGRKAEWAPSLSCEGCHAWPGQL